MKKFFIFLHQFVYEMSQLDAVMNSRSAVYICVAFGRSWAGCFYLSCKDKLGITTENSITVLI